MKNDFPILIVEDNPVSRKLMEMTLRQAGYEVVSAEDGQEALEVFKKRFFPIILTDLEMPEMDGLELCRAIRENPAEGYVYIFLITARDSKKDIIVGLEAGADDYLTKPFNRSELIARLKTALHVLELEKSLKDAYEKIRLLSITDKLTGCYNRTYMDEYFAKEIARATRYSRPVSLMMADIDHFKRVNDTHGHQAGDLILKNFVLSIREGLRKDVDWIARYGGEEFLMVLPETDFKNAMSSAERLRRIVSESVTSYVGKEIRITASFGVVGFSPSAKIKTIPCEALIDQADKALYQAKDEGRNRVRGQPFTAQLRRLQMFTGLAEGMGRIKRIRRMQDQMQVCISPLFEMTQCRLGDSVSVSGACLTVSRMEGDAVYMDVSGETLSRTTLGLSKQGDLVNLERALRLTDRLGGHLVLGHVDGMGKILKRESRNNSWLLKIEIHENLSRYIIEKGSIAVDGISLTINACENTFFEVNIIPHTGTQTTLLKKNVGEPVNVETDLIGKYVEKLLFTQPSEPEGSKSSGVTLETLLKYGFGPSKIRN